MTAARAPAPPTSVWSVAAWCVLLVILTHYLAVLPHEFGHSLVAWATGIKANPLDIHWGPPTLLNALTLIEIDEKVDYQAAWAAGRNGAVALTAITGPVLVNGSLYLVTLALSWRRRSAGGWPAAVLYWFLFMNLANLYDYIPIRTLASHADIAHFDRSLGLSRWIVFVVGTPLVLAGLVDLYRTRLPRLYGALEFGIGARIVLLVLTTGLMFAYFGLPGFLMDDHASFLLSCASLMAAPCVLVACWPTRRWVVARSSPRGG